MASDTTYPSQGTTYPDDAATTPAVAQTSHIATSTDVVGLGLACSKIGSITTTGVALV